MTSMRAEPLPQTTINRNHISEALYNRRTLRAQPADFRISAIIIDGMWWSFEKWRNEARVTEEQLRAWLNEHLANGDVIQADFGARSYRAPLRYIIAWHQEHDIKLGQQIVSFLFSPRIWDGMTEADGFDRAPLREVGTVTFSCPQSTASKVKDALRGVARVRELTPGKFRAIGLSSHYIAAIVKDVYASVPEAERGTVFPRACSHRRELVDFPPRFLDGLMEFYRRFASSLLARQMETIKIFLPEYSDREAQVVDWVISAIEKYDERSAVPFSGYLDVVLKRWPFDLPNIFLGKDLAGFQRQRSRAIKALHRANPTGSGIYSAQELADEIGMDQREFNELEDQHRSWLGVKTATTLVWDGRDEGGGQREKASTRIHEVDNAEVARQRQLAHRLSLAIIDAITATGRVRDGLTVISSMDAQGSELSRVQGLDERFRDEMLASLRQQGVRL